MIQKGYEKWQVQPHFRFKTSSTSLRPEGPIAIYGQNSKGKEFACSINFPSVEDALEGLDKLRASLIEAIDRPHGMWWSV